MIIKDPRELCGCLCNVEQDLYPQGYGDNMSHSITETSALEEGFVLLQIANPEIEHASALFCAAWHNNETALHDAASKIAKLLLQPPLNTDQELRLVLQQIYDQLKPANTLLQQGSWFSFFSRPVVSRVHTCPLWSSIEAFLYRYKTDTTFQAFNDVLAGIDVSMTSICHVVTSFLVQPPRSFLQKHTGASYVSEFLRKLFSLEIEVQFLFTAVCKNEAWPEAPFVLLEVLIERENANFSAIVRSLLERILDPVQQSQELLAITQALLQRNVRTDQYPLIVDVLSEKLRRFDNSLEAQVLKYVIQFLQLPRELHGLESRQFVVQAAFMARYKESYNKKQMCIPRSTIVDSCCYVLSKRKVSVLNAAGSFKRVTSALCFFSDQTPVLVAQSVSSCRNYRTNELLPEQQILKNYTLALREADFALELRDVAEIVQLRSKVSYTRQIQNGGQVPVVSLIWEYYPSNLDEAMRQKLVSSFDKKQIAIDLIRGLIAMHNKELFHWDIKPANVLCRKEMGSMRAFWCDFGMMFKKGETFDIMKNYHAGNIYGSLAYMAPELFVMPEFPRENFVDILVKAEIWALGKVLYELYYAEQSGRGKTPWEEPMFQVYNSRKDNLLSLFPRFHSEIVEGFKTIQTGQGAFIDVIISMLHPIPEQRPSLGECLERIQG